MEPEAPEELKKDGAGLDQSFLTFWPSGSPLLLLALLVLALLLPYYEGGYE